MGVLQRIRATPAVYLSGWNHWLARLHDVMRGCFARQQHYFLIIPTFSTLA
jgi:hypothetical protein